MTVVNNDSNCELNVLQETYNAASHQNCSNFNSVVDKLTRMIYTIADSDHHASGGNALRTTVGPSISFGIERGASGGSPLSLLGTLGEMRYPLGKRIYSHYNDANKYI